MRAHAHTHTHTLVSVHCIGFLVILVPNAFLKLSSILEFFYFKKSARDMCKNCRMVAFVNNELFYFIIMCLFSLYISPTMVFSDYGPDTFHSR